MKYQQIQEPHREAEETDRQLHELENLVFQTNLFWKKQFFVSVGALIVILILLSSFICGATFFFRDYPVRQLMWELMENIRSNYFDIVCEARKELPPDFPELFTVEFRKALRKEMPELKAECQQEFIHFFLRPEGTVKPILQKHLTAVLEQHAYLRLKAKGIQPDALQRKAIRAMNETFAEKTAEQFCREMADDAVLQRIAGELTLIRKSEEYARLSREPKSLLEERFIENCLELLVFQINRVKGLESAVRKELP